MFKVFSLSQFCCDSLSRPGDDYSVTVACSGRRLVQTPACGRAGRLVLTLALPIIFRQNALEKMEDRKVSIVLSRLGLMINQCADYKSSRLLEKCQAQSSTQPLLISSPSRSSLSFYIYTFIFASFVLHFC